MEYKIVELKQKTIAGFKEVTSNSDPDMGAKIGGLWKNLFESGTFFTMPNKVNEYSYGLYSDYNEDRYDVTVGCDVSSTEGLSKDMSVKVVPAGRYAEFVIFGDMVEAVKNAWSEIWQIPLDRTFTGDFEEYRTSDPEKGEIHIFVAIK